MKFMMIILSLLISQVSFGQAKSRLVQKDMNINVELGLSEGKRNLESSGAHCVLDSVEGRANAGSERITWRTTYNCTKDNKTILSGTYLCSRSPQTAAPVVVPKGKKGGGGGKKGKVAAAPQPATPKMGGKGGKGGGKKGGGGMTGGGDGDDSGGDGFVNDPYAINSSKEPEAPVEDCQIQHLMSSEHRAIEVHCCID
jgi:hypothetical protein